MSEPLGDPAPVPTAAGPDAPSDHDDGGDPLEAAWRAVRADWDTPQRHQAFVTLASTLDRLADAAARYRAAADDPALAEGAERGKQRVLAAALARLDALPRTTREDARRSGRWLIPVAALVLVLTATYLLRVSTGRREFVSPAALVLEILALALVPWRRILR